MTLIQKITDQLQVSRQQAEGGVGLLLRYAQTRLSSTDFLRVAEAVPAVSDLIGKAPRQIDEVPGVAQTAWRRVFSGWGALAPLQEESERLGLDRAAIDNFIAIMTEHFCERSGEAVEILLREAWR